MVQVERRDRTQLVQPHGEEVGEAGPSSEVTEPRRVANYTLREGKATASRVLAVALAGVGLSQRSCAEVAGVSRTLVTCWIDEEHPRTIPLGRLLTMALVSRRGREVVLATLTAALSHVREETKPAIEEDRGLRGLMDDLHAEVGDVAAEWRSAIADGFVSPAEAKALTKQVADVERVLATLRHELGKVGA